jgi:hypothetical protein
VLRKQQILLHCHQAGETKCRIPNEKKSGDKFSTAETQKEYFRNTIPSPKKVERNISRKRNLVTHLTSPEDIKNTKQSHEQKQKPTTIIQKKKTNTSDTDRTSTESNGTLCAFSGIACRSPLSILKGDWIASTMQNTVPRKMCWSRLQEDAYLRKM